MALTPPDTPVFDFPHPPRGSCVRWRPGLLGSSPRLLQAFGEMLPKLLCDSVSPLEQQRGCSLRARLTLQLTAALLRCGELGDVRVTPGCCCCLWDEARTHCRAPSALLIPLRGEAEPSSRAAGSLRAPARAVVSAHNRGCPLGHCNPSPILPAGCFEVPGLETLSSAGARLELDARLCRQPFPGFIHLWWTSAPLTASSCCWRSPLLLGEHNLSSPKEIELLLGVCPW